MAEIRHSVCALDCPDCCSLVLNIEDGKATKLRGNPDHPVTRGFLCGKVAQYLEREYHPDRLLYPQRRTGAKGEGRFERISWDDALDTIADTTAAPSPPSSDPKRFCPTATPAPWACSTAAAWTAASSTAWERRGSTAPSARPRAARDSPQALGLRYGTEPEQFRHSKLIIAWGANILGTNVHLWPFIVEARRNGAKLYTIDPNRNRTGAASGPPLLHQSRQRHGAGARR